MQRPKIKLIKMYLLLALFPVTTSQAEYGITRTESRDNKIYGALKWTFGDGIKPEAVLGIRMGNIKSDGQTDGEDISISAKVFDGFELRQVRGKYFYGKENAQAEFNLGYDFKQGSFGGLGVNVPHFNLGADYFPLSNSTYDTFIQFDTLTLSGSSNNKIRCQHNQERLDVSAIDPSVPGC